MKKKVCILNYGSGNVMSVYNMLRYLDYNVLISNSKKEIDLSTHIILPGVGAFSASMRKIEKEIPLSVLEKNVINNKRMNNTPLESRTSQWFSYMVRPFFSF